MYLLKNLSLTIYKAAGRHYIKILNHISISISVTFL